MSKSTVRGNTSSRTYIETNPKGNASLILPRNPQFQSVVAGQFTPSNNKLNQSSITQPKLTCMLNILLKKQLILAGATIDRLLH